jgi:hypothetical protein
MLSIELISGPDVFEFSPGQGVLVYINEEQFVQVRISKVLNHDFFHIHINGEKKEINEVRIVYRNGRHCIQP